jgi:hypothetical protein
MSWSPIAYWGCGFELMDWHPTGSHSQYRSKSGHMVGKAGADQDGRGRNMRLCSYGFGGYRTSAEGHTGGIWDVYILWEDHSLF